MKTKRSKGSRKSARRSVAQPARASGRAPVRRTLNPAPWTLHPRHQDWPSRLFAFVEERRAMPFAWGVQDCCLFVCDGIRAMTGLDPAAGMFRGKYHGATDAARLVRKHGGVEAIAVKVCARHGWAELACPAWAQRGDVVLAYTSEEKNPCRERTERASLGLCVGSMVAMPGPDGLTFVGLNECARAWAIARSYSNA